MNQNTNGDHVPFDGRAEYALIGAVIIDPDQLDVASSQISGPDFHDADLGRLWEGLCIIREAGLPVNDPPILISELKSIGVPDHVRTPTFIGQLLDDGQAVASNAPHYVRQLLRYSRLRALQNAFREGQRRIAQDDADPEIIAKWLDAELHRVANRGITPSQTIGELARNLAQELRSADRPRGIMSGIAPHDAIAGPWMPGELIIVAARTGMGKTSLATQVAIHQARQGRPTTFVSLEMAGRELASRYVASQTGLDSRRLRSGRLDLVDLAQIDDAAADAAQLQLRIWSPPQATVSQIRGMAKRDAADCGLSLLVVDYIGLVRPSDPRRPRYEQVSAVSADLKALAKEIGIPVIALCQLNREADGSEPKLSHLRESGSIEQDADEVVLLHRASSNANQVKLIIAKHRHSEEGAVMLQWEAARTSFQ